MRLVIFLLLLINLSGCFIAPGMKMRPIPPSIQSQAAPDEIKPIFVPINVDLVDQMKKMSRINHDDAYYYHIGPHDVLNIHVWGHADLSGPIGGSVAEQGANASPSMAAAGYLVNTDGEIYFPFIGNVEVAGKTTDESRQVIAQLLKKYIRQPQVEVRVIGFRSKKIYVMGEVRKPGLQPLTDSPMSITEAINLAGGLDQKTADPSHIFVIRGDYARPHVYWLDAQSPDALILGENFRLKTNDVVFVSTAGIARWNRAIDQILPTIQTIWFTYNLIKQA